MQRLLKTRLFSDALSNVHFYRWQLLIVAAAIALVTGKYAGQGVREKTRASGESFAALDAVRALSRTSVAARVVLVTP